MAGKDVRAGKAYVELGLRSKVDAGLQAVAKRLRTFGTTAVAIGGGITAAVAASFGAIVYAGKSFADAGDAIGKMAARTGFGVEALQELSFAAGQSGTDIETIEAATRKMSKVVTDSLNGLKGPAESLKAIGIDPKQLASLSVEDQFERIGEAIGQVDNATRKAAIAQDIFGKSGTKLLPMLNSGAEGIAALRQEARDLGMVLSADDIANSEALNDAFGRSTAAVSGFFNKIGALVAKPLTVVADAFAKLVGDVSRSMSRVRSAIEDVVDLKAFKQMVDSFVELFGPAFNAVMSIVSGVVVGVSGSISRFIGPVTTVVKTLANVFSDVAKVVGDFVKENQPLITTLATIAGIASAAGVVLGGLGFGMLAVGIVAPLVASAFSTIAGVLSAIIAPALAIAAVVGTVAAAIYFYKDAAKEWAFAFWDAISPIREAVASILSIIGKTFGGILNLITAGDFSGAVSLLWTGVKAAFFTGALAAVEAFYWLIDQGKAALSSITSFVSGWASRLFSPVMESIRPIGEFFNGIISSVVSAIGSVIPGFNNLGGAVGAIFADSFGTIRDGLSSLFSNVKEVFGGMASAILDGNFSLAGEIAWAAIKHAFQSGAQFVGEVWSGMLLLLSDTWTQTTNALSGMISNVLATIGNVIPGFSILGDVIGAVFGDAFSYVSQLFRNFFSETVSTFNGIGNAIAGGNLSLAFEILWASAKLAFVSGIGTIKQLWSGFTIGLTEVWQTFASTIVSVFRSMMSMVQSVLASAANAMAATFEKMSEFDPTGVMGALAGRLREDAAAHEAAAMQLTESQNAADKKRLAQQIANGQASIDAERRIAADIAESRAARDALIQQASNANVAGEASRAKQERDALIQKANAAVPGGISAKVSAELSKLEIAITKAKAAAADASGDSKKDKKKDEESSSSGRENIGSFSAVGAALMAMGGGGNVQDKIARHAEKTEKNTAQTTAALKDVAANLKNLPKMPTFA